MKLFKAILIIILLAFTACKSSKITTSDKNSLKIFSSKKIAKKHVAANFDKKTVTAKLNVHFKNAKQDQKISVKLKIQKDEVIWLKGTFLITIFKARITPTKVEFYSPYQKNYFVGDFSMIKKLLGVDINFNQLQNMLLGQSLLDVRTEKHDIEIVAKNYRLSPKKQAELFDIFFFINPEHYKLNKQHIINVDQNRRLDISYPKYIEKEGTLYPQQIKILAKSKNESTLIEMTTRSVVFNATLNMPFKIPEGYKEIKL